MAVSNWINYAAIAPQDLKSPFANVFEDALRGYQMEKEPARMATEQAKANADATTSQVTAKYAEPTAQANLALKQAQAQLDQVKAANPYAAQKITGPAADALSLELVKQQYGEDSEVYANAKKQIDLKNSSQGILNQNRQALTDSMGTRFSSPLEKLRHERNVIASGFDPASGKSISPEEVNQRLGEWDLKILNATTDQNLRTQIRAGKKLDTTLDAIDPDALTQYAGINGLKELAESAKAPAGKESARYRAYKNAVNKAMFAAFQARQQLGEGVSLEMNAMLNSLTNPATYKNNPTLAKELFLQFRDLMKKEGGINRQAATNASIYKDTASGGAASSNVDRSATITVQLPSGATKEVTVGEYLDGGGKL